MPRTETNYFYESFFRVRKAQFKILVCFTMFQLLEATFYGVSIIYFFYVNVGTWEEELYVTRDNRM